MNGNDLNYISDEILKLEKERIDNADWADLALSELQLIDDLDKRRNYSKKINEFHMLIINTFSSLVPINFKFSIPNDKLTCRIMAKEYMNYFYAKGMSREEIIKMLSDSKNGVSNGEKHK